MSPRDSPEPRNPSPEGGTIKHIDGQKIRILEEKVKILKKKLKEANGKIVQLLREKMAQQPEPSNIAVGLSPNR